MPSKPISQREARKLRKRVATLERIIRHQRIKYTEGFPGGTRICVAEVPIGPQWAIVTASQLGHAIVAKYEDGKIQFYALPHPEVPIE